MKEFTTAANEAAKADDTTDDGAMEFTINEKNEAGETTGSQLCRAYKPGDGQLAVLMATTGRHSSTQEQIAGLINFFASTLDDESHQYIVNRLLDRKDKFGIADVQDIMAWMVEEWSGRPTQSPSGSTGSQQRTGHSSTPPTPALT